MNLLRNKIVKILACPSCKSSRIIISDQDVKCQECCTTYKMFHDTPVMIKPDSPVLDWYEPRKDAIESTRNTLGTTVSYLYKLLRPQDRVWTRKSQKALNDVLKEKKPDAEDSNVVLIGAGVEAVYRRALAPYHGLLRVGLAKRGDVDIFSDICDLPLADNSIDLILSSSVLEHVYNVELAAMEMYRVLKPDGYVYAEIPFIRTYHLIPVDYQRYTTSGIEALFQRNGFTVVDKGICSGPFTAAVLFFVDFISALLLFNKYLRATVRLSLSIIMHPLKYLDLFCEDSKWAEICACNFYYIGKK